MQWKRQEKTKLRYWTSWQSMLLMKAQCHLSPVNSAMRQIYDLFFGFLASCCLKRHGIFLLKVWLDPKRFPQSSFKTVEKASVVLLIILNKQFCSPTTPLYSHYYGSNSLHWLSEVSFSPFILPLPHSHPALFPIMCVACSKLRQKICSGFIIIIIIARGAIH